jgi:F0F1-type ATP synthase assembly protein I
MNYGASPARCEWDSFLSVFAIFSTSGLDWRKTVSGKNDVGKPFKAFALASTIAVQFAVSVLLGFWLGSFLDRKLGTQPWLMLGGLLGGIAAGTVGSYRLVSGIFNNNKKDGR